MAERITTRLGTVTLQVVPSSSSESQTVAFSPASFLTTNLQIVTFDLVDLFLLLIPPAQLFAQAERGLH